MLIVPLRRHCFAVELQMMLQRRHAAARKVSPTPLRHPTNHLPSTHAQSLPRPPPSRPALLHRLSCCTALPPSQPLPYCAAGTVPATRPWASTCGCSWRSVWPSPPATWGCRRRSGGGGAGAGSDAERMRRSSLQLGMGQQRASRSTRLTARLAVRMAVPPQQYQPTGTCHCQKRAQHWRQQLQTVWRRLWLRWGQQGQR